MNLIVRRDRDEILVERTMMNRAETQAVADERLASRLRIANDVRCVEQPKLF